MIIMKKTILIISIIILLIGLTGCSKAPVRSLIPDDAIQYETLEEVLEKTAIEEINLPDEIKGFDGPRYYYCTENVVAIEYFSNDYSIVYVVVDLSYWGVYSEDIFVPWKRLSKSSMGMYQRNVMSDLLKPRFQEYILYGCNEDNKGESIYYTVGRYEPEFGNDVFMFSSIPLDFDTFDDLFIQFIVLNQ